MARQQRPVARRDIDFAKLFESIVENIEQAIQGQDDAIRLSLICLVAQGHLLIEDVPGVGKTSLAKAIAASLECRCQRIQFTPDLLPSDVTGVNVYSRAKECFEFRPGGLFANVVLGDEINRASPKTQSALLEAMEEGQVTVDTITYALPSPFIVIATQNPIEHQGTYPLPESQLDRFLMRIHMGYPARRAELAMLDTQASGNVVDTLEPVAGPADVATMVEVARCVFVAPAIKGYIIDLAETTRSHAALALGMSPRGVLALQRSARARAAAEGRAYLIPDDVKVVAGPVLEHRLILTSGAQLSGIDTVGVVDEVLARVPVPTGTLAPR
ncbi:MAG: ATPase [Acidimicrobiales bacterium]|nr:MAG: ATPase [Acidimicrobiales bacterium]